MLNPLGITGLRQPRLPGVAAGAGEKREIRSPYGSDSFAPTEKSGGESPIYRNNPALTAHASSGEETKPAMSAFSRLALAGLAGLSLFGGIIAAQPVMAKAVDLPKEAPTSISQVLPGGQKKAAATQANTTAATRSNAAETKKVQQVAENPTYEEIEKKLEAAAEKHGVPKDVVKAIAWQESYWEHVDGKGNPSVGHNRNSKGKILSSDWGIMQINDYYHKQAFPQVKTDIDANINYGVRLLKDLHREGKSWNRAILNYNGSSAYLKAVQRHMKKKPWEAAKIKQATMLAEKAAKTQLAQEQPDGQKVPAQQQTILAGQETGTRTN